MKVFNCRLKARSKETKKVLGELSVAKVLNNTPRKIAALLSTGVFLSFAIVGIGFLFLNEPSKLQDRITPELSSKIEESACVIAGYTQVCFSAMGGLGAARLLFPKKENQPDFSFEKALKKFHSNSKNLREPGINRQSNLSVVLPPAPLDRNQSESTAEILADMPVGFPLEPLSIDQSLIQPDLPIASFSENPPSLTIEKLPDMPVGFRLDSLDMSRYELGKAPVLAHEEKTVVKEGKKEIESSSLSSKKQIEPAAMDAPKIESSSNIESKIIPVSQKFPICDLPKLGKNLLPKELQKAWGKFIKKKKKKMSAEKWKKFQKQGLAAYRESRFSEWATRFLSKKNSSKKLKF